MSLQGEMRTSALIILLFFGYSYAQAYDFVFKSGKRLQGSILYEDASVYRILDSSGIEMRLRKSELNLSAMKSLNVPVTQQANPVPQVESADVPAAEAPKRTVRVYTNRDVRKSKRASFIVPDPQSEQAWLKSLTKLEKEFSRLQGACRGAGTGPNLSKILRTHTYDVNGRKVKVTAYWADPANIEDAKQICSQAIQTEDTLQEARKQFQEYKQRQHGSSSGR